MSELVELAVEVGYFLVVFTLIILVINSFM